MYEVETKVELTADERIKIIEQFKNKGFTFKETTQINDFYIEGKKSPHGGYDIKRYRQENDKFVYTEKVWEIVNGSPARKEDEYDVSKTDFDAMLKKFTDAVKIKKQREWFEGKYKENDIHLIIDSTKFDHSPQMRFFVEAEICTKDKNKVKETKALIENLLKELLNKPIVESPGMFTMAFNKK